VRLKALPTEPSDQIDDAGRLRFRSGTSKFVKIEISG